MTYVQRGRRLLGFKLISSVQLLRIFLYRLFSHNCLRAEKARLRQPVLCLGHGRIILREGTQVGFFPSPGFLTTVCYLDARSTESEIVIGEGTVVNNGFTAIAETTRITLGQRCLVGPQVTIYDSDFHGLAVADRLDASAVLRRAVTIEDDVFIGANSVILKGVTIGQGSVIAAGSIVTQNIPPNVVAGGNPARVLKSL